MLLDDPFRSFGRRGAYPQGDEAGDGFHLVQLPRLFAAVVVEPVLLIPEGLVDLVLQSLGVRRVSSRFVVPMNRCSDLGHSLQLADQIAVQIHSLVFVDVRISQTAPLVIHAAVIGAVPVAKTVTVTVIGKPMLQVFLETVGLPQ